jgi:hypothetical protein
MRIRQTELNLPLQQAACIPSRYQRHNCLQRRIFKDRSNLYNRGWTVLVCRRVDKHLARLAFTDRKLHMVLPTTAVLTAVHPP